MVIVLAVLQYSWSNQVSEATSIRLADSLQMSMINWHLDLFRELSEICFTLGLNQRDEPFSDLQQVARSFSEWRAGAVYPNLVSNLYVLPVEGPHPSDALRFDSSAGLLERDRWPTQLYPLKSTLTRLSAAGDSGRTYNTPVPLAQRKQFLSGYYPSGLLAGWRFEPTIPALLHPIFAKDDRHEIIQWIVVTLDNEVIRDRVLPDLAQRYFQGTDGLDFQVAVIGGTPRRVIYTTDTNFGQSEVLDADGTMDLFGRAQDKSRGSPVRVFHKPSENKGPVGSAGVSWFPLLSDSSEQQDWQLVVRHRRGGPMGAFAAELRRRDLTISFGVLLLLVISMAMLIITSHRAQRLAKLQMDFVTTVSHELRTPLTVISSAADNISHGVVESKEQIAQYGSVIASQARQLSGLVEQILLFAAARDGRQRYSPRSIQISEMIDVALANTTGLIQTADFIVEQKIEPDLPPVMGDLTALSQCLQNLIINAMKYSRQQRWIGIRAELHKVAQGAPEIEISVSDRGIGIGAADLPHIFEPFYRSSSVAAAQIHGTGLGLPLAKSIAEAMKGQLTVRSTIGEGSRFTLRLPCADPSCEVREGRATSAVAPD